MLKVTLATTISYSYIMHNLYIYYKYIAYKIQDVWNLQEAFVAIIYQSLGYLQTWQVVDIIFTRIYMQIRLNENL